MSETLERKAEAVIDRLRQAARAHPGRIVYPCSFAVEGSLLIDLIHRAEVAIPVVTIDTGRLPQETFDVIEAVRARYGIEIRIVLPDAGEVEALVDAHGPNLFRRSVELRRLCCEVRKVRPLARVLADYDAWITGRRREQSPQRAHLAFVERDDPVYHGKVKYNPIADWTWREVWDYVRAHDVPYHPLHDRFYPSIGCACCTRPVAVGEDPRAGRWWWEQEGARECGLHLHAARIPPARTGEGEGGEGI